MQVRCTERLQLHTSGAITKILQEHQRAECYQRQCRLQDQLWIDVCIDSIWGVLREAAAITSVFLLGGIHLRSGVSGRRLRARTTINFYTSSFKICIRNARFSARWRDSKAKLEACTASWTAFWKKVGFQCSGSAVLAAGEPAWLFILLSCNALLRCVSGCFSTAMQPLSHPCFWNTMQLQAPSGLDRWLQRSICTSIPPSGEHQLLPVLESPAKSSSRHPSCCFFYYMHLLYILVTLYR